MSTPFLFVPVFSWPSNPGGLLYTYVAGTSNINKQTFADPAGTVVNQNPVVLDTTGSALVRLDEGSYHLVLKDPTGTTTIWDADYYDAPYLTQEDVGQILYPITSAETDAGVTPTNYHFAPGDLQRYGADPLGVNDSAGALLAAMQANSDVFDSYPGGGSYLFSGETIIPTYPLRVRGQVRNIGQPEDIGTIFTLDSSAGSDAAVIRVKAFATGIRIENITFKWKSKALAQYGIRASSDLRGSIIEGCCFIDGATSTNIGIQLDFTSHGTYTGAIVIRDNYFSALSKGVSLCGDIANGFGNPVNGYCTTVKITNNEFYGYGGASSAVAGNAIQCDYPVAEPAIIGNYFEGWVNGVNSNGAAQLKQIGNDYGPNTNHFNWTKASYARIWNQSVGETFTGTGNLVYPFNNTDACQVVSAGNVFFDTATANAYRGFVEQGRTVANGHQQTRTFAAGNYTGSGSLTWTVTSGETGADMLIVRGNEATYYFEVTNSSTGGSAATALQISLAAGFALSPTATIDSYGTCSINDNAGGNATGTVRILSGSQSIQIFKDATLTANWSNASTTSTTVRGQITFPINGSVN